MTEIKLFNSLEGQKTAFKPVDPSHVRLYACGPTVYNYAHVGNARMAVVFDLLVRTLRAIYPKVTYASNITDVDDKIMAASVETGEAIDIITRRYEKIYNEDMAALGCAAPDIQPRATEHIGEMITLIEALIARGHAYEKEGHVLFNVPSFPAYGKLSGRSRDDQIAGARVEVAPFKKDPADFVLWKPSAPEQVGWNSPWGRGRPGWHIECSAMAEKHLKLPFDIHGGGADLKFPHHENEIAQSCCAHGHLNDLTAFSKYWVHNGFVTVEGEKMSKSIGNIRLVHNLLDHYDGEVLRLTLLSAHYRQPLDWSESTIAQNKSVLDRIYRILEELKDVPTEEKIASEFINLQKEPILGLGLNIPEQNDKDEIFESLCDDLNTPKAIAALNSLAKKAAEEKTPSAKSQLLRAGRLLGILQKDSGVWLGYKQTGTEADEIEILIQERNDAKKSKNFARADEIRRQLSERGIAIEDTPQGTKWRKTA